MEKDVARAERAILENVQTNLTSDQLAALTSLVYNIGIAAFKGSTLLKKLNAGDLDGAAEEFARWDKVKGVTLTGLKNRRAKEKAIFLREA